MKRLFLLVLVAGVSVWAGALLDFGHPKVAGPAASGAEPAPTAPATRPAPAPTPQANAASIPTPASAAPIGPPVPAAQPEAPVSAEEHSLRSPLHAVGRMARAMLTATRGAVPPPAEAQPGPTPAATGELGEGVSSPEYVALERHYIDEPRDGDWATAHEQHLRDLLREQALAQKLALVHCQQTVCRIVLETDSPDAFAQLLQVPGLSQATTLNAQSPYSFRSGQLSVLFHPSAQAEPTLGRK